MPLIKAVKEMMIKILKIQFDTMGNIEDAYDDILTLYFTPDDDDDEHYQTKSV